jgi:hypothetical protein
MVDDIKEYIKFLDRRYKNLEVLLNLNKNNDCRFDVINSRMREIARCANELSQIVNIKNK